MQVLYYVIVMCHSIILTSHSHSDSSSPSYVHIHTHPHLSHCALALLLWHARIKISHITLTLLSRHARIKDITFTFRFVKSILCSHSYSSSSLSRHACIKISSIALTVRSHHSHSMLASRYHRDISSPLPQTAVCSHCSSSPSSSRSWCARIKISKSTPSNSGALLQLIKSILIALVAHSHQRYLCHQHCHHAGFWVSLIVV